MRSTIRVDILSLLVGLTLLGPGVPGRLQAAGQDELFVSNLAPNNSITVYARTANGNVGPLRTIKGSFTQLSGPQGLAVDLVNDELCVTNVVPGGEHSVTVYARTANGNSSPLRSIHGPLTQILFTPHQIAVDALNNELLLTLGGVTGPSRLVVHARTATGNVAPLRMLEGPDTHLNGPGGLAIDVINNELLVANFFGNSVTVYERTANGNVAPIRTLQGSATGLNEPDGVVVDLLNDELLVTNFGSNAVTVYARTANGNTAPLRTLQGPATQLAGVEGLAVDLASDELFVANTHFTSATTFTSAVTVYERTASGNVAPRRILEGPATGLRASGLALPAAPAPPLPVALAGAAILPGSRAVQVGHTATAFATMLATGPGTASGCTIAPTNAPAGTTFQYQLLTYS